VPGSGKVFRQVLVTRFHNLMVLSADVDTHLVPSGVTAMLSKLPVWPVFILTGFPSVCQTMSSYLAKMLIFEAHTTTGWVRSLERASEGIDL